MALTMEPRLGDLDSVPTHVPSKAHHNFTKVSRECVGDKRASGISLSTVCAR